MIIIIITNLRYFYINDAKKEVWIVLTEVLSCHIYIKIALDMNTNNDVLRDGSV